MAEVKIKRKSTTAAPTLTSAEVSAHAAELLRSMGITPSAQPVKVRRVRAPSPIAEETEATAPTRKRTPSPGRKISEATVKFEIAPEATEGIDLKTFYEKRRKRPSLYSYDGRGNLVIREKDGSIKSTIALPKYRATSASELSDLDSERADKINEAEEVYEQAMEELRATQDAYERGQLHADAVISTQLDVERANIKRFNAYYGERSTRNIIGLRFNQLYPEMKFGTNIIDYDIIQTCVADHPLKKYWVRPMTESEEADEEAKENEEASIESSEGNGDEEGVRTTDKGVGSRNPLDAPPTSGTVILFNRPDDNIYGYLAMDYAVQFSWRGVKYYTADQAMATEKARFFGNPAMIKDIMRTRSTTSMRSMARKLGAPPSDATKALGSSEDAATTATPAETDAERLAREQKNTDWETQRPKILRSILTAKFREHPALGAQLTDTGDAVLAKADHRDIEDGIGIAITDSRAGIQAKWRGKNELGLALMDVRRTLRGEPEPTTAATDAPKEKIKDTVSAVDYETSKKMAAATVIRRRKGGEGGVTATPTHGGLMIDF
jgi:predicted NAD-dependent protein-ADP-ribosyltransferase YbiA (DUF1768 family)